LHVHLWSEHPLDQALELLRHHRLVPYRWDDIDLRVWHAYCPACRTPDHTLTIVELRWGGPIRLHCSVRCAENVIKTALEADPDDHKLGVLRRLGDEGQPLARMALDLIDRVAA
jgi:hypothetical protein